MKTLLDYHSQSESPKEDEGKMRGFSFDVDPKSINEDKQIIFSYHQVRFNPESAISKKVVR